MVHLATTNDHHMQLDTSYCICGHLADTKLIGDLRANTDDI